MTGPAPVVPRAPWTPHGQHGHTGDPRPKTDSLPYGIREGGLRRDAPQSAGPDIHDDMTITTWLKKRIHSGARLLFRRYLDEELERVLPFAVRYQRYLESPPGDRQALNDHAQEPAAHLPLFRLLPARLAGAPPAAGEGAR